MLFRSMIDYHSSPNLESLSEYIIDYMIKHNEKDILNLSYNSLKLIDTIIDFYISKFSDNTSNNAVSFMKILYLVEDYMDSNKVSGSLFTKILWKLILVLDKLDFLYNESNEKRKLSWLVGMVSCPLMWTVVHALCLVSSHFSCMSNTS